jgi:hypothetical protein
VGKMSEYVVLVPLRHQCCITADEIHSVLSATPEVEIVRHEGHTFEFRATRAAFAIVKERLKKYCTVRRERFHHDEGGG